MSQVSTERRRLQFELERCLRQRILASSRSGRQVAVASAYAELFDRFPDHSAFRPTEEDRVRKGRLGAGMVAPLSAPGDKVLEVGCGAGDVLAALAEFGRSCVGLEASQHMIRLAGQRPKLTIVFGTADELGFPDDSFDLVFSQEVLEHLHPDDVPGHFCEAFRVLRPGGVLAVETPNVHTGPQDISRGFVPQAEGLHLKEWSVAELVEQFRRAGFARIRGLLAPQFLVRRSSLLHCISRVPASLKRLEDLCLSLVPGQRLRTIVGKMIGLDDIFLFGEKPRSV